MILQRNSAALYAERAAQAKEQPFPKKKKNLRTHIISPSTTESIPKSNSPPEDGDITVNVFIRSQVTSLN